MVEIRYLPAGDEALVVEYGNTISPGLNARVRRLQLGLARYPVEGIKEVIPSYRSLLVIYDCSKMPYRRLVEVLKELEQNLSTEEVPEPVVFHIPVCYGGEFGPDLEQVAAFHRITPEEVIAIHSRPTYLIYMLGFTAGFPYLGGMDERIATPRLKEPRSLIPAGSVGIAGSQTGIYPVDSPGGWRIIGRTPLRLFEPDAEPPVFLEAGNYLKFEPVNVDKYAEIAALVAGGSYQVKITRWMEK